MIPPVHAPGYERPGGRSIADEQLIDKYITARIATHETDASEAARMRMAGYKESTIARGQKVQATEIYKDRVNELVGLLGGSVIEYAITVEERIKQGEHHKETLAQNVKTLQTLVNISKALLPTIKQKTVDIDEKGNRKIVWQTLNG